MSTSGTFSAHTKPEGVMLFMRGQCTQCGKLTPPVYYDPDEDCMNALARLRDMIQSAGWYIDVYRLFSGPKPGTKVICRCKICDKELGELANKGEAKTITMVTNLDDSHVERSKGVG